MIKHLPGKHRQQTHGRPKLHIEVAPGIDNLPSPYTRLFSLGGAGIPPRGTNNFPTERDELKAKADLVRGISTRTGIPGLVVNSFIRSWAESANSVDATIIRHAVFEEFGIESTEKEAEEFDNLQLRQSNAVRCAILTDKNLGEFSVPGNSYPEGMKLEAGMDGPEGDIARKNVHDWSHILVRDVYTQTQKFLKENGVTELTLHRGIGEYRGSLSKRTNNEVEITDRVLSSWTTELGSAMIFGDSIVTTTVPASDVFSMARLGPGCLPEAEVLLLGGKVRNCAYHKYVGISPKNSPVLANEVLEVAGRAYKVYLFPNIPEHLKPAVHKYGITAKFGDIHGTPMSLAFYEKELPVLPPDYFYVKSYGLHATHVGKWSKTATHIPDTNTGMISTGWGDGSLTYARIQRIRSVKE